MWKVVVKPWLHLFCYQSVCLSTIEYVQIIWKLQFKPKNYTSQLSHTLKKYNKFRIKKLHKTKIRRESINHIIGFFFLMTKMLRDTLPSPIYCCQQSWNHWQVQISGPKPQLTLLWCRPLVTFHAKLSTHDLCIDQIVQYVCILFIFLIYIYIFNYWSNLENI